ncbi:histidine kinase dimerization and phosphoacceptor region (plasmid) [Gemmatirosa kalamazoonensis]|uniref:Oxygen sensor histidine kinase NreB n=1 Tax=Gemmatirosa kalamazoonensis TaxID=861299 RepID=W0RNI0_9BACT|nr:sensor histidine kinase [Gemmatirosa kalamazoonensis]AHG92574.1 histidine kinase dimerization and phosphoacceptor region [Gemmatirosa kalamazoonensis]
MTVIVKKGWEPASTGGPVLRRAVGVPNTAPRAGWLRRVLGVSLLAKLVGANVLVALAAAVALLTTPDALRGARGVEILAVALGLALLLNGMLVVLALRPVREIEAVAARVWRGDFGARVVPSPVADAELARLGCTLNLLLDGLASDRDRLRAAAAQTMRAQDAERSRIARELHDSVAQSIAALAYQLTAAARDATDPATTARLAELRAFAGTVLEEVRALSHTVHPRVLDDLGLVPGLQWLARTMSERSDLQVTVTAAPDVADGASPEVMAALYRVAQESLRNVERHAHARTADVRLARDHAALVLEVRDDGDGFSLADAEARRPGMGLFAMRERVDLVNGRVHIDAAPGRGTRIRASVPIAP